MNTLVPRRRLLQLLAAVPLLGACTSSKPPAAPDPDDALRAAAVERERALLALYDAAAAGRGPADAAVLQAVRGEHAQHLAALLEQPSPSAAAASASPTTATRAQLVSAERSAAQEHAAAAVTAGSALAGVLASLSASEASHAVVLA